MRLDKQLIMTIGMTHNNWELTKEMVENSIDTFYLAPIVWNKQQSFKNYTGDMTNYYKEMAIGFITEDSNIIIEDDNVFADICLWDKYQDLWKGHFDNWCIQPSTDKKSFKLCSIEVF